MIFASFQTVGQNQSNKLPGQVGLRSYFDSGSGTDTDPFVITRPVHLYNLSRLQALGAFTSKKYFSLGKQTSAESDYFFYASDTDTNLTSTYLDMSSYGSINSIGSTASPFFGEFDGHGKTIYKLKIDSEPEDIGVFGYVSSGAKVKNTTFSNLTVTDNGYQSAIVGNFYDSTYLSTIKTNQIVSVTDGTNSSQISNDWTSKTDTTSLPIEDYSFVLDESLIPASYSGVTYEMRSTNNNLFVLGTDGNGKPKITINRSILTANSDFISASGTAVYGRFYVTASIVYQNVRYAKILSSYSVFISNSLSTGSSVLTLNIAQDPDSTANYNYTHNTNIGFIAGHCDGSMTDDYVYCGNLKLNQTTTNGTLTYVNQAAETELGLIGEVGININNTISPKVNYDTAGDTGIINFTNIYKNIIDTDNTEWDSSSITTGGQTKTLYVIKYRKSTNSYDEYLRKRVASTADQTINGTDDTTLDAQTQAGATAATTDSTITDVAITNAKNSIDFQGQRIIKENSDYSRGLGVFQLNTSATAYSESDYASGMGDFTIKYDSATDNTYSNVYYSTAEFNATVDSSLTPEQYYTSLGGNVTSWSPTSTSYLFRLNQGTYLPTSSSTSFFPSSSDASTHTSSNLLTSSRFEKNFNYLIKLSLEDLNTANSGNSDNYFYNTNNGFLRDYFTYKLRDKNGDVLDKTSSNFGVMIKEKNGSTYSNSTAFSSYLGISEQSNGVINAMSISDTDSSGTTSTVTVPTKTIEFSVKNDNGANITLLAASDTNNESHVCIYDKSIATFNGNLQYTGGYYPSYAMYIPANDTDDKKEEKMPYYFNYSNTNKNITSSIPSKMSNNTSQNRLYAHTFYIPKGEYFIGSPDGNAKIYYMAVQGQNGLGNLGDKKPVYFDNDSISNVDFILNDPTAATTLSRAYVDFQAYFDALPNILTASINNSTLALDFTTSSTAYSYLVYNYSKDIKNNQNVYVNGTSSSKTYIKSSNWVG
jgi:hypothetical protein